ncbi:MAG: preprotein translocase subunit Sec61beta [Candidatus Marsarchaeota archaeon]|jgi:preprotein translocase subunit Sec61beta|nr:preprotein translocase subunit Sec61beta [Candidatus Marsarchaeota archaeon]MCL5434163.1 preprotein translocase subunit Sec61beta [Candidatus Marsarchaeota archaeon]
MASLYSPQSQAGVLSFYDAPSRGPKINPKVVIVFVVALALIILVIDHFIYV